MNTDIKPLSKLNNMLLAVAPEVGSFSYNQIIKSENAENKKGDLENEKE